MGINPERGGRPPIDSMRSNTSEVARGNLFHIWDRDSVVVEELCINSIKVPNVIVMYISRLSIVIVGLYTNTAVIHPMWEMDEYARIFRSWVWLSPPHPPTNTDVMAIMMSRLGLVDGAIWYKIDSGAIFCQVNKTIPDSIGTP